MMTYKALTWRKAISLVLLFALLSGIFPGSFAFNKQITTPDSSSLLAPGILKLQVHQDESGEEDSTASSKIQWLLTYNGSAQKLQTQEVQLLLSPGQVFSNLEESSTGISRIFAVSKDEAMTEILLYEKGKAQDFTLDSTSIDHYRLEFPPTDETHEIGFSTAMEDPTRLEFEALVFLQGETPVHDRASFSLPSNETTDIQVFVHWVDSPEKEVQVILLGSDGSEYTTSLSTSGLFQSLPLYTQDRQPISYRLTQEALEGFSTHIQEYEITNTKISSANKETDFQDTQALHEEETAEKQQESDTGIDEKSATSIGQDLSPKKEDTDDASSLPSQEKESALAPKMQSSENTESGSGNLLSYGSYTWSAVASSDGSKVTWTLSVTETGSGVPYLNYMEFKVPSEFLPISQDNIRINKSTSGEATLQPLDDVGRFFRIYNPFSSSATNHSLEIVITTIPKQELLATTEYFTLPYLPATQRDGVINFITYGPTDKNTLSKQFPVTGVTWLTEATQPTVKNPAYNPTTDVKITVSDQDEKALAGAQFTLSNNLYHYTSSSSDAKGIALFTAVIPGDYLLSESEVPLGYAADEDKSLTITPSSSEFSVQNTKVTSLEIIKVDSTDYNKKLSGAVFHLSGINHPKDSYSSTMIEPGIYSFSNVKYGRYTLAETTAPQGYLGGYSEQITVDDTSSQTYTLTNEPMIAPTQLVVSLVDEVDSSKKLAGASFVVMEGQKSVSSAITDEQGYAIFHGLSQDKVYTIMETKPPQGYMPMSSKTLTLQEENTTLELSNAPLQIKIDLQDQKGTPISESVFEIINAKGETIFSQKTTAEGTILFSGAPLSYQEGYQVIQKETSSSYALADSQTVIMDSQTKTLSFVNGKLAHLTLFLTNPQGQALQGAQFLLKDLNYNVIRGPLATDEQGKLVFSDLTEKTEYRLEQISAPTGYETITPLTILLEETNQAKELVNVEGLGPGSLQINLVDGADSSTKLPGGEFKITGPSGTFYVRTNTDGVAVLSHLNPGVYSVLQTKTTSGYAPSTQVFSVEISSSTSRVLEVQNQYTGTTLLPGIIKTTITDLDTKEPIQGVTLRATDDLGNVHYGISDAQGVVYFGGLDITRTYSLQTTSAPYVYGANPIYSVGPLNFATDPALPLYIEASLSMKKNQTNPLYILVHEEGDVRVGIAQAKLRITLPDGKQVDLTTNPDGMASIQLSKGFVYKVQQLSTDGTHVLPTEEFSILVTRPETLNISNKLKDYTSAKRSISVTKKWIDPKPASVESVTITLFADGKSTGQSLIFTGEETKSFTNLNKYNDQHQRINYTVKESELANYYAVYEKGDTDGNTWTVNNYEGGLVGNCMTGNFWVSDTSVAYEVTWDGKKTGNIVNMGETYGYGIAVTPVPYGGKYYLMGMKANGYVQIWDITNPSSNPANPTPPVNSSAEIRLISMPTDSSTTYANTLGFSHDGAKLFVGRSGNNELLIYNAQDVLERLLRGESASPGTLQKITLSPPYYNSTRGFAGDVIELPNGDLLMSASDLSPGFSSNNGTGLFIAKRNSDGSYTAPAYAGNISSKKPLSGGNTLDNHKKIEGLALVYAPDGSYKIVIVGYRQDDDAPNSNLTAGLSYLHGTPSIGNNTYQVLPYNTSASDTSTLWSGYFADASSNVRATCSATVSVSGSKKWIGDLPEHRPSEIQVVLYQNGQQTEKIKTLSPDAYGNWIYTFTGLPKYDSSGVRYKYSVQELDPPPGYEVTQPPLSGTTDFNITNTLLKTDFRLQKSDLSGSKLQGAEFTLYGSTTSTPAEPDENNVILGPIASDENGILTFTGLPMGRYFLKETKAPQGYLLDENYYPVVVSKIDGQLQATVFNGQSSTTELPKNSVGDPILTNRLALVDLSLKKVDQDGNVLPGAKFKLSGAFGFAEYTVDETGLLLIKDLTPGDYILKESSSPQGYYSNTNTYYIHVDQNEELTIRLNDSVEGLLLPTAPLVIANYKKGFLEIKKVDDDGNIIGGTEDSGAQFTLKGKPPLSYNEVLTVGDTGLVKFEHLEPGVYTLQETRGPTGYSPSPDIYTVSVSKEGKVTLRLGEEDFSPQPLVITNHKHRVTLDLHKVDAEGKPLAGASFQLYDAHRNLVKEDDVDEKGILSFESLELGTYYLKEVSAPEGYLLDPREYEIALSYDGQSYTTTIQPLSNGTGNLTLLASPESPHALQFNNYLLPSLEIMKVDPEGVPINSDLAHFELRPVEGSGAVTTYSASTDDKGIASFPLIEPGQYSLVETKAPHGYMASRDDYLITVTPTEDFKKAELSITRNNSPVDEISPLNFENKKLKYPATGGRGMLIYHFGGIFLMILPLALLKRKSRKEGDHA